MRALPRLKESIYEKDHDETERNSLGPGCGIRGPGSRLGRVGNVKLNDDLMCMT